MFLKKTRIILFTTKTLHHSFLIKKLEENKLNELYIFYETKKVRPNYKTGDIKKKEQIFFEKKNFFNNKKFKIKSPIFKIYSVNSNLSIKKIKKINPDLGIIFGTGKVSEKLIKLFNNKIINIHRGIMKKYRGLDSEFWAAYNKDFKSIGTTVHFVDKYLDKGSTIMEKKMNLKKNMQSFMLRYYTTKIAADRINLIISNIKKKKFKKNKKHGKYYSFIPLSLKKIAYKNFDNYCKKLK